MTEAAGAPAASEQVEQDPVVARVADFFPDVAVEPVVTHEQTTFRVPRERIADFAAFIRDEEALAFTRLSDVTAVDYADTSLPNRTAERFAVVYHFYSFALNRWIRARVGVDEDDALVPSLTPGWPTANWLEREVYDMFGIVFTGHPDLKRILMPDDWVGYPLRKDWINPHEPVEFSTNPEEWQKAVQRGD